MTYDDLLIIALEEARKGFSEGGVPVGAPLTDAQGCLLGCGRNRRAQDNDPSVHGETDAFRRAGRQIRSKDKILVTTLVPCEYCSGLIRRFNIGTVVIGELVNFEGRVDWLKAGRYKRRCAARSLLRRPDTTVYRTTPRSLV